MLDDFLATMQKKLKRLCYELIITLNGDPPDVGTLQELYLRVLCMEGEFAKGFANVGSADHAGVKEVFSELSRVFEQVLSSLVMRLENREPPSRSLINTIHTTFFALNQMIVLLRKDVHKTSSDQLCFRDKLLEERTEPIKMLEPETAKSEEQAKKLGEEKTEHASEEKFTRLIDLLGELMMSKRVFRSLSHQALIDHKLPGFAKELKTSGNRLASVMERLEEAVLGLCQCYTNLAFQKRKVLPFNSNEQAFILEVEQILEVVEVSQKEIFKRRGQFFYHFRGETLGLVFLSDYFARKTVNNPDPKAIIVITDGITKLGLGVEHWWMEQEVIVKPLLDIFVGQREITGAAVMESGQISLMLDGAALIKKISLEQEE